MPCRFDGEPTRASRSSDLHIPRVVQPTLDATAALARGPCTDPRPDRLRPARARLLRVVPRAAGDARPLPQRLHHQSRQGRPDRRRNRSGAERRERFPNAAALQKYAGVAPVTERSGNKSWVHWRYSCPKFLRQSFIEWVAQTIPRSFWAQAFHKSCRARGMRHQAALRALAFTWIRILHRCWVERTPYDESRYCSRSRSAKRRSPSLLPRRLTDDHFSVAVRLRA